MEEVCTEVYTCWKDGYYYFEAVRLEDIMQTLSRWYNIQAFFVQPELKDIEFTGRLKRMKRSDSYSGNLNKPGISVLNEKETAWL